MEIGVYVVNVVFVVCAPCGKGSRCLDTSTFSEHRVQEPGLTVKQTSKTCPYPDVRTTEALRSFRLQMMAPGGSRPLVGTTSGAAV